MEQAAPIPVVTPAARLHDLQMPQDTRPNAIQRRDPMTRVRIQSRTDNQVIPGGYILPRGESTCVVYTPDLPAIFAMIEREPQAIAQAEEFFIKAVENEIRDELRDISDLDAKRARLSKARQEFSGSIEGTFHFLHKRDILPLISVEILDENIPAPVNQGQVEHQSFLAITIAREVASALAAALPAVIAAAVQGAQSNRSSSGSSSSSSK